MKWSELERGDVLVDRETVWRSNDYTVILVTKPPAAKDPEHRVELVSLMNNDRWTERLIDPDIMIDGEWRVLRGAAWRN